ncbi:MAG: FAD-dependent oxidoreductase [Vicinamibacteria bacterium]
MRRREFLTGLGSLPLLACARREGGRTIAGSIVGGNHARGHLLREGFRPAPARREEVAVAILGGGIAGLSAAWAFERAGFHDFVVLELESDPGGTSRSGTGPVTPYPWAAHYVPVPAPSNRPLVALLDEVGAVAGRDAAGRPLWAEHILCREPEERVYFRGEWFEGLYPRIAASPEELRELHAFEADMRRWAEWRDARGRRAFDLPRVRCADAPELRALDAISFGDYLEKQGWRSPRLRWFAEYACRDDFGAALHQTSAWAGIHYFAARIEAPGAEPAPFLTWPEGNGRLVRHLAGVAGSRLRLNALVADVAPRADSVDVLYHDALRREAVALRARHAVFALPRFVAGHVIAPWREAPPAFLGESVYGPWLVANLTLRERPASRGFPLAWDNVLYDSTSLGYVVATHQSGSDHGPTVFTYYHAFTGSDPRADRERMLATSWDEWVERIVADLAPAHPGLLELVERVDVYLWGHAMVRPRPGFVWSEALARSARSLGRVHFAHTDLSAMALFEEAQYWGIRAAETVLRAERRSFATWLDGDRAG